MLPRSWKLRVRDILGAIDDVKQFSADVTTAEGFRTDKKTYFAVLRCLEIIGEAAHHVPEKIKDKYPEIPWRKLKDFRNILIHEYFGVDDSIVWKTAKEDILPLKAIFEKIINSEKEE